MIMQTPSITTSMGCEGMYKDEPWGGAVADDVEAFVEAAVKLYTDEEAWVEAQKNGTALLHAHYDAKKLGVSLIEKYSLLKRI